MDVGSVEKDSLDAAHSHRTLAQTVARDRLGIGQALAEALSDAAEASVKLFEAIGHERRLQRERIELLRESRTGAGRRFDGVMSRDAELNILIAACAFVWQRDEVIAREMRSDAMREYDIREDEWNEGVERLTVYARWSGRSGDEWRMFEPLRLKGGVS